jgi:hypothetical protein
MGSNRSILQRTILITRPVCVINHEVYLLEEAVELNPYKAIDLSRLYADGTKQFIFVPINCAYNNIDDIDISGAINCYFVKPEHKSELLIYANGAIRLKRHDMKCTECVVCPDDTLQKLNG